MKLLGKYKIVDTVSEQGVSEAVGFIIIFSLVMIGIGLVTLYGYPILLKQQSNANVRNMERDMIILQNDLKSLVYKNVPYKETSLQVGGGSLAVLPFSETSMSNSSFEISVDDNPILTNYCGEFRYDSDATNEVVVLENGAVLYREQFASGSTMLAEPRWFIDKGDNGNITFVVTFINLSASEPMAIYGVGTIKMRVNSNEYNSPNYPNNFTVTVKYAYDSTNDFSRAWGNYFTKLGLKNTALYEYTLENVNTLIIKTYDIRIEGM